jgi:hypothetical protein
MHFDFFGFGLVGSVRRCRPPQHVDNDDGDSLKIDGENNAITAHAAPECPSPFEFHYIARKRIAAHLLDCAKDAGSLSAGNAP